MEYINFVPKEVQRTLSSHKTSENYNEQKVFYRKAVLKIFSSIHKKIHLLGSRFNKNADLQAF